MFNDLAKDKECALAISRLAPQDYHRFHSPVEGTIFGIKDIAGELFSESRQEPSLKVS
jgi:phosphatidylserine decarboxylase